MPNSIKMKTDIPCNYENKRLPILDMEMWVENNIIHHNHYSKPMASKAVIMERSAFTTKDKKNILMEEANRRLRNCDPSLPWETKRDHLTLLNIQMMEAGHSQRFRDMVTSRSVARYQNSLRNHTRQERGEEGGRWLYRTKEEREAQWTEKGGRATKADWFRRGGHTSILNEAQCAGHTRERARQQSAGGVPADHRTPRTQTRCAGETREISGWGPDQGKPFP